jgi:hypothetical protein
MYIPLSDMSPASGTLPPGSHTPDPDLLLEVDFKWLMAGQGCWVDPQRLHTDPHYAHDCLDSATHSPCDALRDCARHLQRVMEPPAAAG